MSLDIRDIADMDRRSVLHPFTQLKDFATGKTGDPTIVTGGKGIRIQDARGNQLIDAFAGLYCVNIGYGRDEVEKRFGGMVKAFRYGAPPHGGCAAGIDRIVMLLADEVNIRQVIMFPMNQRAEDLLMQAPAPVPAERLKELSIKLDLPKPKTAAPPTAEGTVSPKGA